MPRRFAVYDAAATPVLLVTGDESDAAINTPPDGACREVGMDIARLEDVPPLDKAPVD